MTQGQILIIDDSEAVLSRVKLRLEDTGYTVITSSQTVGAARHLRSTDLVIIDYHMPGMNGQAVLESLRSAATQLGHPTRFYLYTSDPAVANQGLRLGFDGGLHGKGDDDQLVSQVDAIFRLIRLRSLSKRRP